MAPNCTYLQVLSSFTQDLGSLIHLFHVRLFREDCSVKCPRLPTLLKHTPRSGPGSGPGNFDDATSFHTIQTFEMPGFADQGCEECVRAHTPQPRLMDC